MNDAHRKIREGQILEAKVDIARKARDFKTAFSSPAGERVLKELKLEFSPPIIAGKGMDSTTITIGAAQRDVMHYIDQLINYEDT